MQEAINNKYNSHLFLNVENIQKEKIDKQASTGHIHINNIYNINIFVQLTVYDPNTISVKHLQIFKMLHLHKHTSTKIH